MKVNRRKKDKKLSGTLMTPSMSLVFRLEIGLGSNSVSKFDPGRRYSAVRLLAGSRRHTKGEIFQSDCDSVSSGCTGCPRRKGCLAWCRLVHC
jgi:hypothetical protein